jgi:hypothetical protein
MYWPLLSNYTLWPVKLAACDYITDAMQPGTEYPYAVQRWNTSSNAWETITDRIDVSSLAFSPDGKILAMGDYAGDVRLWFSATDKEVAQRNR